jgi:hypothetical protein
VSGTSDQADSASPVLRRIAAVQGIALRIVFISSPVWILSRFTLGLLIGAGGPEWLFLLVALPAAAFIVAVAPWVVSGEREGRYRRTRATAEDLVEEREVRASQEAPDGSRPQRAA